MLNRLEDLGHQVQVPRRRGGGGSGFASFTGRMAPSGITLPRARRSRPRCGGPAVVGPGLGLSPHQRQVASTGNPSASETPTAGKVRSLHRLRGQRSRSLGLLVDRRKGAFGGAATARLRLATPSVHPNPRGTRLQPSRNSSRLFPSGRSLEGQATKALGPGMRPA